VRALALAAVVFALLLAGGCDEREAAEVPPPRTMTAEAVGNYCGMNVLEHPGPKGQIILESVLEPLWFSSARDTFAFTMLPEEPKDIRAIYVSDMGRAESWEAPGADNWVEARQALFVVGSRVRGGMGADEVVPFSERAAADRFAAENGGRVVGFDDVSPDDVLSAGSGAPPPAAAAPTD
jgi:copper chaperone NosL